ncbi:hypothetical protein Bca52824_059730 [Brassica carinata]|uniref:Uncharacterized protein n=1 Tax=Brassica carinata TaxID=52824 RepID=A0A8X7QV16_BRACI|nr:hypothetical protein Bca52824_059730 [Brassica carinata]
MAISLLCLFLITFASLIFVGKKIKRSKWNLPPSPPQFPIIGNLHQVGELPHRSLGRLAERTGHVMLVHLGLAPVTVVSSKEAAEEVLRTHDLDCCTRPNLVGPKLISRGFKDIGFSQYSEEWKERRKFLVRELFSLKRLAFGESFHESKFVDQENIDELVFEAETALASFTFSDFFPIAGVGWLVDLLSGQHKRLKMFSTS